MEDNEDGTLYKVTVLVRSLVDLQYVLDFYTEETPDYAILDPEAEAQGWAVTVEYTGRIHNEHPIRTCRVQLEGE